LYILFVPKLTIRNHLRFRKLISQVPVKELYPFLGFIYKSNTRTRFFPKIYSKGKTFYGPALRLSNLIIKEFDAADYRGQEKAYDKAEIYGMNILSRIVLDTESQKYKWLGDTFNKSSITFDIAQFESAEALFGMVFSFSLATKDPLRVDPEFWNDREDFCDYP
jgi:hypothetical protein